MPKTPQKMQEVFEHHLGCYQIDRLVEMCHLLLKPDTYGCLPGPHRNTIEDALIVGFCIHAKNLLEFLSRDPQDHYAASADYADNDYQPWKIVHGSRAHELKGKLNNQLSHLTYERTDRPNEKIGVQERRDLLEMIHDELVRWIAHLKPGYDRSKLNIAGLAAARAIVINVSTLVPANTTTSPVAIYSVQSHPVTGPTGPAEH